MTLTIPTDTYQSLLTGYFGYLGQSDQDELWQGFLVANGIKTTATLDQDATKVLFRKFLESTYTELASLQLSPDEIRNRHLVYTIFDILITLMGTIQDTFSVLSKNITILAKTRQRYSEEISRIPFYAAQTSSAPSIDTTNLAKWTLGYAGISMQDYLTAAIAGGDAKDSQGHVITPGVGSEYILTNAIAGTTLAQANFVNSTNANEVKQFILAALPLSTSSNLTSMQSHVIDLLAGTIAIQNFKTPPSTSPPLSWVGKDLTSTSDILNIPNDWFGFLMLSNLITVLNIDERSFMNNSVLTPLREAAKAAFDSINIANTGTTAGLTFKRVNNQITITFTSSTSSTPVVANVPILPNDTFTDTFNRVTNAFKDLLTQTVGTSTVLTLITNANLHHDWNAILNTAFSSDPNDTTTQGNVQKRQQQNQLLQQFLESTRVKREVVANMQDSEQTTLNQAREGITQAAQIISAAIRQLENIIAAIFKIG